MFPPRISHIICIKCHDTGGDLLKRRRNSNCIGGHTERIVAGFIAGNYRADRTVSAAQVILRWDPKESVHAGYCREKKPPKNFRLAAIVLTTASNVAIYPFGQKYFVKGILAGSVKG